MALDEMAMRRAEFDETNSVRIKLADGQDWAFPKPYLQIHAKFRDGKAVDSYPVLTCGPELDDLIDACVSCQDNTALLTGVASLGAMMLTRNYALSDEQLDQLFAFRPGDPSSFGWVKSVMAVATGASDDRSFGDGSD